MTCGVTHLNVCEAEDTQDVCGMQCVRHAVENVKHGAETCEASNVRGASCT